MWSSNHHPPSCWWAGSYGYHMNNCYHQHQLPSAHPANTLGTPRKEWGSHGTQRDWPWRKRGESGQNLSRDSQAIRGLGWECSTVHDTMRPQGSDRKTKTQMDKTLLGEGSDWYECQATILQSPREGSFCNPPKQGKTVPEALHERSRCEGIPTGTSRGTIGGTSFWNRDRRGGSVIWRRSPEWNFRWGRCSGAQLSGGSKEHRTWNTGNSKKQFRNQSRQSNDSQSKNKWTNATVRQREEKRTTAEGREREGTQTMSMNTCYHKSKEGG